MISGDFVYMWQYLIDPACREAFLAAYVPGGAWTALFSRDPAYFGTLLIQDIDNKDRYVTIDFWRSATDRDAFRDRFRREFDGLDAACESLTLDERFLGDFSRHA